MTALDECRERHYAEALKFLESTGQDLFTECDEHPQLSCAECDGVHCHRSCDEVARTECRRKYKMRTDR